MQHPQVADGEDGLQIWRVATNILNKHSRTADRGRSSSLGVGLTTPHQLVMKCHKGIGLGTDSLNKRIKLRKMDMRFGMWIVRSLYRTSSLMTVAKEIEQ
jgi:hypothetical protein